MTKRKSNILLQWMTSKEQLSQLELDLCDKNKETLDLKQELNQLKSNMKELQNENGDLEEDEGDPSKIE